MPWFGRDNPAVIDTVEQVSISSISNNSPPSEGKNHEQHHDLLDEAADIPKITKSCQWDANLPHETLTEISEASKIQEVEVDFAEDFPYEEFRAAVRTTDGEVVANTVRAWVLDTIFVAIGSELNMFFFCMSFDFV